MAADRQHHKSKKSRYTIVLVPDGDASKTKNLQLAPWQLVIGLILFAALSAALVIVSLTYTPLGQIFPLSNTGLENTYRKELVLLNQRMTNLMEQLIELRTYNVKLRRVLGENVILSDSGFVAVTTRTSGAERSRQSGREQTITKSTESIALDYQMVPVRQLKQETAGQALVSFPAILPAEGYITRGFEPENNHFGLDIAGKTGTMVVAAADGNIIFSGWTYNDGYVVIMSHSGGFMSYYKHNQSLLRSAGSFVRRGEPIAALGNSGATSSGPHLHFEIWKDGVPVDPSDYMINIYL